MDNNYVSLGEMSIELKVNKSKLAYYLKMGLIVPKARVGNMNVFDRKETFRRLEKIEEMIDKGISLKEILDRI